ncbi:MAG: hypothetical protein HY322_06455 [Betaproteobacteria bacterium]|nr:hypothetical protein [Betaproteobacteria bacterium]
MRTIKKFLCALLAGLLAFTPPVAYPAFDPVNDDTDIFLANPNVPAQLPNILIILDNTANWNSKFANEKTALVQTVGALDNRFNVGLMMMPETGVGLGNDNTDGGYVRFAMRQMQGLAQARLISIVNGLDILGDRGNNATHGAALYEAYLYFKGLPAAAGDGKVKSDHVGNVHPPYNIVGLGNNALPGPRGGESDPSKLQPTDNGAYTSPISDGCQKNVIILISNGPADQNQTEIGEMETRLAGLTGQTPPAVLALKSGAPTGRQGNWSDEMAKFMFQHDFDGNPNNGVNQNVITYVVEVDKGTTGLGPDWSALMESTAVNGGGKYFDVQNDPAAIAKTLLDIFNEVQAVNSVFAATTLPVSVNVRGTNLNQVYVGVFRPDAKKAPRWLGNLKMYQLGLTAGQVVLKDADDIDAENPNTGFINSTARSFWTANSSFWSFVVTKENPNGAGGASDRADGDLVEKGAAAQQVRTFTYPNPAISQTGRTSRNVYTCTDGGSFTEQCTAGVAGAAGSQLSLMPFTESNTDITTALLDLGTRLISSLTGFVGQDLTTLTDRQSVTLNNSGASVPVASLSNGGTTRTITSLTTADTVTVTNLDASQVASQVATITNIQKPPGNPFIVTVSAATPLSGLSAYVAGASVSISGNSNSAFNTTFTIGTVNTGANTFTLANPPNGNPSGTGGSGVVISGTIPGSTARATAPGHSFADNQTVTIAGAAEAVFNNTFTIVTADPVAGTFTFNLLGSDTGSVATTSTTITASANTTTARATYSGASLVPVPPAVTADVFISGANPAEYNTQSAVVPTTISNITFDGVTSTGTFRYAVAKPLTVNTGSPVYAVSGASTTVNVVTAAAHGLSDGGTVNISGSDVPGYNGTFTISCGSCVAGDLSTTFSYTTASPQPANNSLTVTAGTSFSPDVIATAPKHGFSAGQSVIIDGEVNHRGTVTISTRTDDQFTYPSPSNTAPTGAYTVRPVTPRAIATISTGHGYTNGQTVYVSGATPAAYNHDPAGVGVAITVPVFGGVPDPNLFFYTLASDPASPNTATPVKVKIKTKTAFVSAANHGFNTNDSVTIANASPNGFNGVYTVTKTGQNTFTYSLTQNNAAAPAQGDATGSMTAAGVASGIRTNLINWVRGEDNNSDENSNGSTTDVRASVHGDVLHSRPAVINYNRTANSENDVYVFYGANDGLFHAIRGGQAIDAASANNLKPGEEAWAFVPQEFFGKFQRMRNNDPLISSSFKKPYFMDGPIGVFANDANDDGKLDPSGGSGDRVILYITNRRGVDQNGRGFIYALDVTLPEDPKFMWKITSATTGFGEIGQTWSQPVVVTEGLNGYANPVVVFAAGYDPAVEDLDPAAITGVTATTVTTAAGTVTRSMGRAIYVLDALTGTLVWSAGGTNSAGTYTVEAQGMDYAIPAGITVIKNESGGAINRAYVGDTGGQMWRIDFKGTNLADSTVTLLATIADSGNPPAGLRKFLHGPDVVGEIGFDAILVGSGDREHPFDTSVVNRFYMFKDKGNDAGPVTGTTYKPDGTTTTTEPPITEAEIVGPPAFAGLSDLTSNCIQDALGCLPGETQTGVTTKLGTDRGWFITLGTGEKAVGSAISLGGTTFFNTNQPDAGAGGGLCIPNLGVARQYAVSTVDATIIEPATSRSTIHIGGGFLPDPVHVVVVLGPPGAEKPYEAVISGIKVSEPPGTTLQSRLRKYWYKVIDQ